MPEPSGALEQQAAALALPPPAVGTPFGVPFYPPPPAYSSADPYFAWRGMYNNYPGMYAAGANYSYPPPNGYPAGASGAVPYPCGGVDPASTAASASSAVSAAAPAPPAEFAAPGSGEQDRHSVTIDAVVDRIVAELKQILKKDFNRRMVEGTAFKGISPMTSIRLFASHLVSFILKTICHLRQLFLQILKLESKSENLNLNFKTRI